MTTDIYYNPRCSKCRQTLALLREHGIEPNIIEYLNTPPDETTLRALADQLGIRVMIRAKEQDFRDLGLDVSHADEALLLRCLLDNSRLLERPIVVHKGKAAIGRPPELILPLLQA